MDDSRVIATTSAIEVVGYDALTPLLRLIFGSDGLIGSLSIADVLGIFGVIWAVITVVSYIISFIFLVLYVYAAIHYNELEEQLEEKVKTDEEIFARSRVGGATANRFADMQAHVESDNPNDWKLAIIEADIILDEALKQQGFAGTSIGERLRSVSPQSLASLDDAWQAHKIRNEIAHSGPDFVLTQKLARETIARYQRVFSEMKLM